MIEASPLNEMNEKTWNPYAARLSILFSKMLSTENREAMRICDSREKTLGFKHFSMHPFQ